MIDNRVLEFNIGAHSIASVLNQFSGGGEAIGASA